MVSACLGPRRLRKRTGPPEGGHYKGGRNPRGQGEPRPYKWEQLVLVRGFDFGFGDFFGDLGGGGELGAVPAAAEGFDELDGSGHLLRVERGELLLVG